MIRVRQGRVINVIDDGTHIQVLTVLCGQSECAAICYPPLTGAASVGDIVTLNTTAVWRGLGTGGFHFVMAICGIEKEVNNYGHIMKARYTPHQVQVLTVEEEASAHHQVMQQKCHLNGMPVAVATLHSLIAPFAVYFKARASQKKLAYIMTDGAALPVAFSNLVRQLRQLKLIDVVITCAHAYGGELETVTAYSALQAAASVAKCHTCIIAMGPGVVGTNTPLGTTALEQAPLLDGAGALGARTLAIPRLSITDERARQYGLSHHSATALGILAQRRTTVVLPKVDGKLTSMLTAQLDAANISKRHDLVWVEVGDVADTLDGAGVKVTSMGRSPANEPLLFAAGAAAGELAAQWCC